MLRVIVEQIARWPSSNRIRRAPCRGLDCSSRAGSGGPSPEQAEAVKRAGRAAGRAGPANGSGGLRAEAPVSGRPTSPAWARRWRQHTPGRVAFAQSGPLPKEETAALISRFFSSQIATRPPPREGETAREPSLRALADLPALRTGQDAAAGEERHSPGTASRSARFARGRTIARMTDHDAAAAMWTLHSAASDAWFTTQVYTMQGQRAFREIRTRWIAARPANYADGRPLYGEFERLLAASRSTDAAKWLAHRPHLGDGQVDPMLATRRGVRRTTAPDGTHVGRAMSAPDLFFVFASKSRSAHRLEQLAADLFPLRSIVEPT